MYDPARDSWQQTAAREDGSVAAVAVAVPPAEFPAPPFSANGSLPPPPLAKLPPPPVSVSAAPVSSAPAERSSAISNSSKISDQPAPATQTQTGSATLPGNSRTTEKKPELRPPSLPIKPTTSTAGTADTDVVMGTDEPARSGATSAAVSVSPVRAQSPPQATQHQNQKYHQYRTHRQNNQQYRTPRRHDGTVARRDNEDELRAVQEHYNSRPNYRVEDRKHSEIYGVRTFNNFIKSILIDRFTNPHDVVLDVGCGRGGDLHKWLKAGIDGLIGIDIADVSVNFAKERYQKLKNKVFWVDFCVGDAYTQRIEDIVHPNAFPVDSASCQFALHYAFSSEVTARMALDNISRSLRRGGMFVGTIPNSEYLAEHLRAGETKWGNSIFEIAFDEPNPKAEFKPIFGHRYSFFLQEAVEEVPEYVVPREGFETLAREYGLRLELFQPFMEFFRDSLRDRDIFNAAESSHVIHSDGSFAIPSEQLAASEVYAVFAFVKE